MLLSGCGEPASEDLSGKVTFKGEPVTEGRVTFFGPKGTAQSRLGEDGVFTLLASQGVLAPGEYKVMITPILVHDPSGDSKKGGEKFVEEGGKSIPTRYRKRNKTPLRATIPGDSYDFDMVP